MLQSLNRAYLRFVVWFNRKCKSAAIRLTKLTGKSRVRLHPKHLAPVEENTSWYLDILKPGMRVLDVGCANGVHSLRAAERDTDVIGVDFDLSSLQTARILAESQRKGRASFFLGNLEQGLPVQRDQFDVVIMLDVIEHLHRRVDVLQAIHAALHKGGILAITAPRRETSWKKRLKAAGLPFYSDLDHKWEYTWEELVAELRSSGFEPVGPPNPIVYDTPWAGVIDLTGGFSLDLYRLLTRWKVEAAQRHPEESIGWRLLCRRID